MTLKLFIFHLLGVLIFGFGCYYDWNYVIVPKEATNMFGSFGWKLKFLTYWDALVQTVFYVICLLNDIVGSNEIQADNRRGTIRKLKDTLMTCIAYPLSMFVGLTFWGLYAVDRELVFPKSIDPYFPTWLNHVMHTNIMVFILIEMFCTYRSYPLRKKGIKVLITFMAAYLVWMHIVYYKTGVWVYPVMEVLPLPFRLVFFVGLLGLATVLYISGEILNKKIWGNPLATVKRSKVK